MRKKRSSVFVVALFLLSVFSVQLRAQAPLGTTVLGMPITWAECKNRVSDALTAEGFGNRQDFGNGWQASKGGTSTSVGCIQGNNEAVVMIVVSGDDNVGQRSRLLDLIRNPRGAQPAQSSPVASTGNAWRLKEVRVYNQLDKGGSIIRDSYDANGGFSELQLSGDPYGLCPGGSERIRMTWRFPTSVASLNDGDKVSVAINGAPLGATGGCNGGLAARAYITAGGSNGDTNPFNERETAAIDGDRFWPAAVGRASADPNPSGGIPNANAFGFDVDTRPHYPDRPRAWFNAKVITSAGMVRYVYIYEFGGGGAVPAPLPNTTPSSKLTWRLRDVRVFNQLEKSSSVIRDSYDATGGLSELQLSGDLYGLCPGGSERIRMTWRFPTSVDSLDDGDKVSSTITGASVAATGGCKGGLAARAYMTVGGSNGDTNPFNERETRAIDGDRFWPAAVGRASPDPNPNGGIPNTATYTFEVDTRPHYADRQRAWFNVKIITSAGMVRYVYLYELGTAATVPPFRPAAR